MELFPSHIFQCFFLHEFHIPAFCFWSAYRNYTTHLLSLYLSVISFHLSLPIFYRNSFGDRKHGKKYIVDSERVYKNISSEGNKVEHYYQHIIISQLISFLLYADSTNAQKILTYFPQSYMGLKSKVESNTRNIPPNALTLFD